MFPRDAQNDVADQTHRDAVSVCDNLSSFAGRDIPPDLLHIVSSQLRSAGLFANGLPILCDAVGHIGGLTAREQMVWPDARPMVATMKDLPIVWYSSVRQEIGGAVRKGRNIAPDVVAPMKHAVAIRRLFAGPYPALTQLRAMRWDWTTPVYFRPKSREIDDRVSVHLPAEYHD